MTTRNKYGAQKITYFGITFDSKAEGFDRLDRNGMRGAGRGI